MTARTIQSLDRALGMLETVARVPQGLSLSELARAQGLKMPTAHHLAGTLVARGYLSKSRRPLRYRMGSAILNLAAGWNEGREREALEEVLRASARSYPRAVWTVARAAGGELRVMMRMSPDLPAVVQYPRGRVFAPYHSASGLAYLAFADPEERLDFERRHPFGEYGSSPWVPREDLPAFLARARARGCVVFRKRPGEGVAAAGPVFMPERGLAALLGVAVLDLPGDARGERRVMDCLRAALRAAAETLSGGAPGAPPIGKENSCNPQKEKNVPRR